MTESSPTDHPSPHERYRSPLESRNASEQMRAIFSEQRKFSTWRRIWHALAATQQELGLPISDDALAAIEAVIEDIDFPTAASHEARLRHDVMAHVHTLGEQAPAAAAIIHLGATSQDVVCNADLLVQRDALSLICMKLARVVDRLGRFAADHRDVACLGFTHYQPAQPTTVGKRACLWAQDFTIALEDLERRRDGLRFRGMRGATGTQASFLGLLDRDAAAVDALEAGVAARLGWPAEATWPVCGQTYPRLADAQILNGLATAAAAVHKCCNDLRLLANLREVEEPFEKTQIGSSAMAYKRNPMRCERATGLARFVMNLAGNGLDTAATQWMERTLDDSANRRLSIPEAFLALDGCLDIMNNVTNGLIVNRTMVARRLAEELPFLATEDLMLEAARRGGDRQDLHEVIRVESMEAGRRIKEEGLDNDLIDRLRAHEAFRDLPFEDLLRPERFIGRASEQVDRFLETVVTPVRDRYTGGLDEESDLRI